MSKVILVTGGMRSGKSSFGEELLKGNDNVLYIATSIVTDEEMKERIEKHREKRNKNWITYEGYKDLNKVIEKWQHKDIILECITTMITNLMFDKYRDFDNISKEDIEALEKSIMDEILKIVSSVRSCDKRIIIITNEVGFGLVSEYKQGRIFTDISGRVNQMLGKLCDEAYLVVSGLPLKLK